MDDRFKIYIDRLKDQDAEKIEADFSPHFMEVQESGLSFEEPIHVEGEAFLNQKSLVIHLSLSTQAKMPCAICNEMSPFRIEILNYYHEEEIGKIKKRIFDLSKLIREMVLLEVPLKMECHDGHCPERDHLVKYLHKE